MTDQAWLVEIRLKDWVADIPSLPCGRVVMYVEVLAQSEISARFAGFDEFDRRRKSDPFTKRTWDSLGLTLADVCTPSAIEIGDYE